MAEKKANTKKRSGMKSIIGGTILTDERVFKQFFPFVIMLVLFALSLIMVRNRSIQTIRNIGDMQKEIEALRSEHATVSAKLMDASRPSEVIKKVDAAGIGLEDPVRPPRKLIVKE